MPTQQTGAADASRRNTTMRDFKLPASVQLYGAFKQGRASAVRLHRRQRHRRPAATVPLWLAAGTKTFLLRFREKEHEMRSLEKRPRNRSTFRLISCAATALLAYGASILSWFLRRLDYRRTLNELHNLSDADLRDLRISKTDFNAIARAEAERLQELRHGSRSSTGSPSSSERSRRTH
jgi:uncharacterized protein YjiS (DUF1127 family)